MRLDRVWLTDFRGYASAYAELAPGLTAVVGANGQGKSNLLEAVGYLANLRSFRGAATESLVRAGADRAIVRGEGERLGRALLVECEIAPRGRSRTLINRQPLRRTRDALDALRAVVFAPDDLALIKGGPGHRRDFLDDTLAALHPGYEARRSELERILRQRNTLLKQAKGRLDEAAEATLDVWDTRLAEAGEAVARDRVALVAQISPLLVAAYGDLAGSDAEVHLAHQPEWRAEGLGAALARVRPDELRRGVSLVGPHRDEVDLAMGGLPARTHGSQGEQRSLALALRLAAARLISDVVLSPPLLLLDDVFSELDPERGAALLAHLPAGQTVITTAGPLPGGADPGLILRVEEGRVGPG